MPKLVITAANLPLALHTLDKWAGKLTWDSYAHKLSEVLGVGSISRHTLLKYTAITHAFELKKKQLKEDAEQGVEDSNATIELLKSQRDALEAKVNRLEHELALYREQFVRWQQNIYMMPGVDFEKLDKNIDMPLPSKRTSPSGKQKKASLGKRKRVGR